jgi:transposase
VDLPWLQALPAVASWRQVWAEQYTDAPGPLRWRTVKELAPPAALIASPHAPEARYSTKRAVEWVGYKVHLPATCDAGPPPLITQVLTTPATTPDGMMGPTSQRALAQCNLLPGTHLLDGGDVDAELLVTALTPHQRDVVGPALGSYRHPRRAGQGDALSAVVIAWEAKQARCPQGQTRVKWTPGRDVSGAPVIRIRLDRATYRAWPARQACTWAKDAPRQLSVRPQLHHAARQAARQRQETAAFKAPYAARAGVEGTHAQGLRRCGLRQSRDLGLAKTHLQPLITAVALNVVRLNAWWRGTPLARTRVSPFAALPRAVA